MSYAPGEVNLALWAVNADKIMYRLGRDTDVVFSALYIEDETHTLRRSIRPSALTYDTYEDSTIR